MDIVLYTLARVVNPSKGWGFRGDTFECQNMLGQYGLETWFNLGDKDLATHIYRTEQMHKGRLLSEVTQHLARHFGLRVRILPATDNQFQTYVVTNTGRMHFEEYMVKRQTRPKVHRVTFEGAKSASPAKHVIESIRGAKGVIISPSNPIVSIGAILEVPGIRSALQETQAKIVGISPILAGKTVKGPADKLMKGLGLRSSALGIAEYYNDFLDTLIIDRVDKKLGPEIEKLGIKPVVTNTLMRKITDKISLAKIAVRELQ